MGEQRLHNALAPVDILTRLEHEAVMHHALNAALKEKYRGVEAQRFPRCMVEATGASVNLFSTEAPTGPEQGDFWEVRRVVVKSNIFTDTAKYILFRGSSPSDIGNAYGPFNLIEAFAAAGAGQAVGVGYYPSSKSLALQPGEQLYALVTGATAGNVYMLDGEAIRVPSEMKGKILSS
jgi:hypothetical protein